MTTAESSERQSKGKFVQGNFQTNETELNSGLCDVKLNSLFFFLYYKTHYSNFKFLWYEERISKKPN